MSSTTVQRRVRATTRRRSSSTRPASRRAIADPTSRDDDTLLVEDADGPLAAFCATEPRRRPDGSASGRGPRSGRSASGRTTRAAAWAGAPALGRRAPASLGVETVTLQRQRPQPAGARPVRGGGVRARTSTRDRWARPVDGPPTADAREPARRGGRGPAALGGGPRGPRDRVLRDLLRLRRTCRRRPACSSAAVYGLPILVLVAWCGVAHDRGRCRRRAIGLSRLAGVCFAVDLIDVPLRRGRRSGPASGP